MDGKVKISHQYWWENAVYYRRSVCGGNTQVWNGQMWTDVAVY